MNTLVKCIYIPTYKCIRAVNNFILFLYIFKTLTNVGYDDGTSRSTHLTRVCEYVNKNI